MSRNLYLTTNLKFWRQNNMKELLKRLLEAEILTAETMEELEKAFNAQITEAKEAAEAEVAADVRAELTEAFVAEKERLVEAVDAKLQVMFSQEVAELKEDFEAFRDLEAEYAEKIVEAKAAMADELQEDMTVLVDKIDTFMEIKLNEEIEELREDIDQARKQEFGRRIFEAVAEEYMSQYHNEEESDTNYADMEARLEQTQIALEEAEQNHAELARVIKLDKILSPLSGNQREVMEQVLQNVATHKLEEGFKTFLPRIIRETNESEKEDETVLSESAEVNESTGTSEVSIVTGDVDNTSVEDDVINEGFNNSELQRMLKLAGL